MIYERPSADDPIRQGDLFKGIPRVGMTLDELPVVGADERAQLVRWEDLPEVQTGSAEPLSVVVGVRPVVAIVLTQDCDAVRSPDITLAEVAEFSGIDRTFEPLTEGSVKWVGRLVQQAKINQKWFYLPKSEDVGFRVPMGVDFRSTMSVGREDLERMRATFRIGRLNRVASEHFRERIAEFFRRYAYDEWYPLTKDELEIYKRSHPGDIKPYEWQR